MKSVLTRVIVQKEYLELNGLPIFMSENGIIESFLTAWADHFIAYSQNLL